MLPDILLELLRQFSSRQRRAANNSRKAIIWLDGLEKSGKPYMASWQWPTGGIY